MCSTLEKSNCTWYPDYYIRVERSFNIYGVLADVWHSNPRHASRNTGRVTKNFATGTREEEVSGGKRPAGSGMLREWLYESHSGLAEVGTFT